MQTLLSVPPHFRDFIHSRPGRWFLDERLAGLADGGVFVGTDPRERRLGSGGGTVALLVQAWRDAGRRRPGRFFDWLAGSQRLVLHSGGESRRLPAYSAVGKSFIPIPAAAGLGPRRFDQMLVDLQVPTYLQVLREAGPKAAVMVTSGDVWLDFDPLQVASVQADITGMGMSVSAEVARHFGVYFVRKEGGRTRGERSISFFLQKPAPEEIYRHAAGHEFYVDTGMWLLSVEALRLIFLRCGWDDRRQVFTTKDGHPQTLDLYTELGTALGETSAAPARLRRLGWDRLRRAVVPLELARFHHLGSSRQVFDSFDQIQSGRYAASKLLSSASACAPAPGSADQPAWLDGVRSRGRLALEGHNVVTGLPPKSHIHRLGRGWCVEAAPVGSDEWVLRPYHLDDTLRGTPGQGAAICGHDAALWLKARARPLAAKDVFDLEIYPVVREAEITQELLDWFFDARPDASLSGILAGRRLLCARAIAGELNFARLFAASREGHEEALCGEFTACLLRADTSVFDQDFAAIAEFCRDGGSVLHRWITRNGPAMLAATAAPEHASRLLMLLSELASTGKRKALIEAGYRTLREAMLTSNRLGKSRPCRTLKDDQIVWARSPARLDLAGGWTDTPPYCLEMGGAVVNVAVLLNGQPPIQVFVRPISEPIFRLRSIDLGSAEDISDFDGLSSFNDPRSGFNLPKAALMLVGFHPDFVEGRPYRSLGAQLRRLGGGLEISLLSAVPKGSGLGTSSILGATLLGALNRACSLGWDDVDLYRKVMGIEQLLTTGGGWQDQAGALFGGIKLVETRPGADQTPAVRRLPAAIVKGACKGGTLLLYYTGVTRLAKGILKEIVQDMFLRRTATMRTLALIGANARCLQQAIQGSGEAALQRCIARSWDLNKRLDPGTTTPEIERIIAVCGADLAACKLLGAGGGGYMILCARDAEAGRRIRERLESSSPNARARFIDADVSESALEVTVS
jgi:galactokinase/mevalonate kinase-like predicted kinase